MKVRGQKTVRDSNSGTRDSAQSMIASIAAIGSILAASSCCLPILPFLAATGFAGASALFAVARPYLLVASVLCISYGFYSTWRAKKCSHHPSVIGSILLWVSAVFVIVSIFFPQVMANAAANLLAR